MQVMTWLRLHHWLVLVGLLVAGLVYAGAIDIRPMMLWLADGSDAAAAGATLADPDLGHADALLLLFSTVFLGPLAVVIGVALSFFALAVAGSLLGPVLSWFRLPQWVGTALAGVVAATVLWKHSGVWMPESLHLVGLVVRACRIVVNA